jgi:hypothetical protein
VAALQAWAICAGWLEQETKKQFNVFHHPRWFVLVRLGDDGLPAEPAAVIGCTCRLQLLSFDGPEAISPRGTVELATEAYDAGLTKGARQGRPHCFRLQPRGRKSEQVTLAAPTAVELRGWLEAMGTSPELLPLSADPPPRADSVALAASASTHGLGLREVRPSQQGPYSPSAWSKRAPRWRQAAAAADLVADVEEVFVRYRPSARPPARAPVHIGTVGTDAGGQACLR